jgi:hypothetical protein
VHVYVLKRIGRDSKRKSTGIEIKIVTGRDRVKKGRKSRRRSDRYRKKEKKRKEDRDKDKEIKKKENRLGHGRQLTSILDSFQQSLNGRLSLFSRLLAVPCQVRKCQLQTNNSARQTSALVPYILLCHIMSFCVKSN